MGNRYDEFYDILSKEMLEKNLKYYINDAIKNIQITRLQYFSNRSEENFNYLKDLYERTISFFEIHCPEECKKLKLEYETFIIDEEV